MGESLERGGGSIRPCLGRQIENIKANAPGGVDIRVVDWCDEEHFGRLKRISRWNAQAELELAFRIGCAVSSFNDCGAARHSQGCQIASGDSFTA